MYARRTVATALAALALLAGAAQAANPTLDGQRKTTLRYEGQLDDSTLASAGQRRTPVDATLKPDPSDCTKTSCHISTVRLTVPRGRQSGRFEYEADLYGTTLGEASLTSMSSAALYDSAGEEILSNAVCCDRFGTLRLAHPRLLAGTYTVIIYNQGQPTRFEATLSWHANPPHRGRR